MSTSVSPSDSHSDTHAGANPITKSAKTGDRTVKVLIIIACAVVLLVVGFFVIRVQGSVSGSEFSPTHFQQREFSFYEIPLIHLQITPIRRSAAAPSTGNFLRQKGMIKTPQGQPADWHLVSITRGFGNPIDADPHLLIEQIRMEQESELYWRTWSIDHPKLAGVLWPVIQKLAERELYILMPRLFEISQADQSVAELKSNIDSYLIDQYSGLIKDMVAADRHQIAEQLVAEARADYPDAASWQSFLVKSNP